MVPGRLCPDGVRVREEEGVHAPDLEAFVHDACGSRVARRVEVDLNDDVGVVRRGRVGLWRGVHVLRHAGELASSCSGARLVDEMGQEGLLLAIRSVHPEDEDLVGRFSGVHQLLQVTSTRDVPYWPLFCLHYRAFRRGIELICYTTLVWLCK